MSARTQARLARILAVIPWVIAHPEAATVDEVCRRFGYTRAELADDIGLVMVCSPSHHADEFIEAMIDGDMVDIRSADYFGGTRRLTASEGLQVLSAALAAESAGVGSDVLRSAAAKLSRVLLPDDTTIVVDAADDTGLVDRLRTAAATRSSLGISYRSVGRDEPSERTVDPWQVFTDRGRWYLDAFDHRSGEHRRFRVDRIRSVADAGAATLTPPDPLPHAEAGYEPSEDDVRVVLRLGPQAHWVAEYYPVTVLEVDGDALVVEFLAYGTALVVRLLLRLGPDARLVEGEEVAADLAATRQELLARYGD